MTFSPWVTKARLRVFSRATSATVPSATRSSRSMILGSARSPKKPAAAKLAQQRDAEQERHADRGDMAVRGADLAFVEAVGVDHRNARRGSRRGALVVVDDDHVEPGRRGLLERLERLRAAIDGDRQARAVCLQLDQRLARRAIALHQPVGDVGHRIGAEPAQQQSPAAPRWSRRRRHSRRRWRCSRRASTASARRARALVHVLEHRRVGQEVAHASESRWRARSSRSTPRASSNWSTSIASPARRRPARRQRHGWPLTDLFDAEREIHANGIAGGCAARARFRAAAPGSVRRKAAAAGDPDREPGDAEHGGRRIFGDVDALDLGEGKHHQPPPPPAGSTSSRSSSSA